MQKEINQLYNTEKLKRRNSLRSFKHMPLKIELKPHESIIIGESLITNDGERTRFYIEGNVPILREKFILREKEANTPCKRVYFVVQQMYLAKDPTPLQPIYLEYVRDLQSAAPSLIPYIAPLMKTSLTTTTIRLSKTPTVWLRKKRNFSANSEPCRFSPINVLFTFAL